VSFFIKKRRKNCSQSFQVLRLQAVITPQWLHIAWNSLSSGPCTGCLVSIFTVRINSKSFPWAVRSAQGRTPPRFFSRRPYRIVSYRNGDISHLQAANHHRLLSYVTLCLIECSKKNSLFHICGRWNKTEIIKHYCRRSCRLYNFVLLLFH